MPLLPVLFGLFIGVPLLEIWLLIKVGGVIGVGWTMASVVATAVVGAALVRAQGLSTYSRIHQMMARGETPAIEVMEGLVLFLAGALLLTPGFFTDALGFLALVPPLRRRVILSILSRGIIRPVGRPMDQPRDGAPPSARPPLEGKWRRNDD